MLYRNLRVGDAFRLCELGAVFVRCRGGYRPGNGGELNKSLPGKTRVFPYIIQRFGD